MYELIIEHGYIPTYQYLQINKNTTKLLTRTSNVVQFATSFSTSKEALQLSKCLKGKIVQASTIVTVTFNGLVVVQVGICFKLKVALLLGL